MPSDVRKQERVYSLLGSLKDVMTYVAFEDVATYAAEDGIEEDVGRLG